MEGVTIPEWVKPNGWVFYAPSRVVFQAARLQRDRAKGSLYLRDANGHEYPLTDCQELTPGHLLQTPAQLIWPAKPPAQLTPAANGFVLTAGYFKKKIIFPDAAMRADQASRAAYSLAQFFNGVVIDDEG